MFTQGSKGRSSVSLPSVDAQAAVRSVLQSALLKDRLPHALLFLGPARCGQRGMVEELAKALFCSQRKGAWGCGDCVSCRQVASGNHPDFRIFEPEEDSRVLKVERVREMIASANLKPFQAPHKLFVMDRAEALNETSQNALLKTLEEPPAHTTLVLISYEAEKILSTIRSRCQTLHFLPVSSVEENVTDKLALAKSALWNRVALGRAAKTPDLSSLKRDEVSEALEHAVRELREALLIRVGSEEILGEVKDRLQKEKMARSMSEEALIERLETLAAFKERIENSVNLKLALSVLWEEL